MTDRWNAMTNDRLPAMTSLLTIALMIVVITAAFGMNDASAHHRPGHASWPSPSSTTTTPTVSVTLHIHDQEDAETQAWADLGWWDEPTHETTVPVTEKSGHRWCTVEVAEGARGVAVLEAAKSTGCIRHYELDEADIGYHEYLSCIDTQCNQDVRLFATAGATWVQCPGHGPDSLRCRGELVVP